MKCERIAGNSANDTTEVTLITQEEALSILGYDRYNKMIVLATEHGVAIAGPITGQDPYLSIRFTRE